MTLRYRTIQTTGTEYLVRPREYVTTSLENLSFSAMLFDDAWPMLRCYESSHWEAGSPRIPRIGITQRPVHPDCTINGPEACAVCRVFYRNVQTLGLRPTAAPAD